MTTPQTESREERLDQVLAAYLKAAQGGAAVDRQAWLDRYPDLAADLGEYFVHHDRLEALVAPLHQAAGDSTAVLTTAPLDQGQLGDFRLLRELGRGGMGIVYEAEQVSLGRRVALKVLPLAAMMDPRHLQRFKNEAQAAAQLQHQNIVPVHFVGCDRGVHFYAMQFIDGQSLAEVIDQLRRERRGEVFDPNATMAYSPHAPPPAVDADSTPLRDAVEVTQVERAETTAGSVTPASGLSRAEYFRWVAHIGEQAALALEHAHQLGVLHRDIKPANLMLDARDNLWVTDFGLAHLPGDQRLTITGDLLGTLRYMSPEQALAQPVVVDQRTDVYSLGVTLYELLTLRPAYSGNDRQQLLRQIAFDEPKRPRKLDSAIPLELETIVLKAMAKAPDERYTTAKELADDLRHWLEDRPIKARRPAVWLRMRRWGRRHRPLMAAAMAALLMGLVVFAGSVGWVASDRATRRAEAAKVIQAALAESADWQQQGRLPEALSAAHRAQGLLAGVNADPVLRQGVERRCADLELVDRLQERGLTQGTGVAGNHFDWGAEERVYKEEFQAAGFDIDALGVEEVAKRIQASSVAVELAGVIDRWSQIRQWIHGGQDSRWKALLQLACLADPDAWRAQVRHVVAAGNRAEIRRLVAEADVAHLPPTALHLLTHALQAAHDTSATAEAFVRAAQRRYPGHFGLSQAAVVFFSKQIQPPRWEEALGFARAAVSIRPESSGAHLNLGAVLYETGRVDDAIAECCLAIRLKKDYAGAHDLLGIALIKKGRLDDAVAEFREAVRLDKDDAWAHNSLGNVLLAKDRLDDAIAEFRAAVHLKKDDARAHNILGFALSKKGRLDDAIAEFREAIRLEKDDVVAHYNLGAALCTKGRLDDAIAELREATRLNKDDATAHYNLGIALSGMHRPDEAMAEYRDAIRLKPDFAQAHLNLAMILRQKRRLDEAVAEYRAVITLQANFSDAHYNLGACLSEQGQLDEAITQYREAIRHQPANFRAHGNLGNALAQKGRPDEAIAEYEKALQTKPDYYLAHENLARVCVKKRDMARAIAEFRAAVRLRPDRAEAHLDLGIALREQGRLDDVIAASRAFVGALPTNPEAHFNLGCDLRDKGRIDEAITAFCEAIRLKPDYAEAHCNLGIALVRRGRFAEAVAALRRADELGSKIPGWHSQRYNAACAAVLASCGQGKDQPRPDASQRAVWRQQALSWLRADLAMYARLAVTGPPAARAAVQQRLEHWQRDPDLAGVRGVQALARLPEAERGDWQKLWQRVEALRRRAAAAAKPIQPGTAGDAKKGTTTR